MASGVIPLNVVAKDDLTITADGEKTMAQLLRDVYTNLNWDRFNYVTPVLYYDNGGFRISNVDNGIIIFTRTVPTDGHLYVETLTIGSPNQCKHYTWLITTSGITVTHYEDRVLASGTKLILYYLS